MAGNDDSSRFQGLASWANQDAASPSGIGKSIEERNREEALKPGLFPAITRLPAFTVANSARPFVRRQGIDRVGKDGPSPWIEKKRDGRPGSRHPAPRDRGEGGGNGVRILGQGRFGQVQLGREALGEVPSRGRRYAKYRGALRRGLTSLHHDSHGDRATLADQGRRAQMERGPRPSGATWTAILPPQETRQATAHNARASARQGPLERSIALSLLPRVGGPPLNPPTRASIAVSLILGRSTPARNSSRIPGRGSGSYRCRRSP